MYTKKLKFPQRINSMHCVFPSVITYILAVTLDDECNYSKNEDCSLNNTTRGRTTLIFDLTRCNFPLFLPSQIPLPVALFFVNDILNWRYERDDTKCHLFVNIVPSSVVYILPFFPFLFILPSPFLLSLFCHFEPSFSFVAVWQRNYGNVERWWRRGWWHRNVTWRYQQTLLK